MMGEKNKATQTGNPKDHQMYDNSIKAQRARIRLALRTAGEKGLTTIQLRENFDCMMPAARVYELRHEESLNIQLIRDRDKNAQGNEHNCGRYILFPGTWEGAV